ncbi:hypothetical protein FKM82_025826 [Ascaphus truei]
MSTPPLPPPQKRYNEMVLKCKYFLEIVSTLLLFMGRASTTTCHDITVQLLCKCWRSCHYYCLTKGYADNAIKVPGGWHVAVKCRGRRTLNPDLLICPIYHEENACGNVVEYGGTTW